jgi:hypothetical protein
VVVKSLEIHHHNALYEEVVVVSGHHLVNQESLPHLLETLTLTLTVHVLNAFVGVEL